MKLDELKVGDRFMVVASDGVAQKCGDCGCNVFIRGGILNTPAVFFLCDHCGMKHGPGDIPPGATLLPTAKSSSDPESIRRENIRLKEDVARKHKALLTATAALRNALADIEEAIRG